MHAQNDLFHPQPKAHWLKFSAESFCSTGNLGASLTESSTFECECVCVCVMETGGLVYNVESWNLEYMSVRQ